MDPSQIPSHSRDRRQDGQPSVPSRLFDLLNSSPDTTASEFTPGVSHGTPFTTAPFTGTRIPNQHRPVDLASLLASPNFSHPQGLAYNATTPLGEAQSDLTAPSAIGQHSSMQGTTGDSSGTALPRNRFDHQVQSQGARAWNTTDFDDRWLLQSDQIWNIDPASRSTTTMAPDAGSSRNPSQVGLSQLSSTYPRAVSELQEVVNTNVVVRELLGERRRITCVYPYPEEAVRHMLYTRLFNNGEGPPALSPDDAAEMFVYHGKFVTRQVVRYEVLAIIDLLVQNMTRDPSAEYHDPEARLSDWLNHTSVPGDSHAVQGDSIDTHPQGIKSAVTRPSSRARNNAFRTLSAPSLHAVQQAQAFSDPNPTSVQNVAPVLTNIPAAGNKAPQAVHHGQAVPMLHPQPQSAHQPVFLPTMAAPNAPMYVTAGPGPAAHSFHVPGLPSMPYQTHLPPHLYPSQAQQFNAGFMPPGQFNNYVPWPMPGSGPWHIGDPGYLYGGPQIPMIQQQPLYQPQMPAQYMPRQRTMQNLNPFPNALGSSITTTGTRMAAGITSAPGPNLTGVPRAALPAASRQARTSGWAKRTSGFNVAAWAQEHRPQTPPQGGSATSSSASIQPITQWGNRFGNKVRTGDPIPNLQILPYLANVNVEQRSINPGPSQQLQNLVNQGAPAAPAMTNVTNMPFVDNASGSRAAQWGVMRIGNIPYGLTKQEVVAFLGKNAKIVTADLGSPIHIVMDRLTGKTMDCYIEFFSVGDAQAAVNAKTRLGNIHKLGDRVAEVGMSSQDELMKELFPKAKQIEWDNGMPFIIETDEPFNSGFKSFITGEELVMLVKHAEFPQRSTYTARCPQRTYESMISTLYKVSPLQSPSLLPHRTPTPPSTTPTNVSIKSQFPWHAAHLITLGTRNAIFEAVLGQIRVLISILRRTTSYTILGCPSNTQTSHWSATYGATGLTHALLQDLLLAGLNASGFSESQRWHLVWAAEWVGEKIRVSPLARWWPFEVLGRKVEVEEDVVEYYIHHLTAHLISNHPMARQTSNPFRTFSVPSHPKRQAATIAEQGEHELAFVLQLYGYVLPAQ